MKSFSNIVFFLTLVLVFSCNKSLDLKLPNDSPQLIVEFFLEDNKPLRCVLQESLAFTDTARFSLISGALVVLMHEGVSDTLLNRFYGDAKFGKIYNYYNPKIISLKPGVEYKLYIKDNIGREIYGSTYMISPVKMDSAIIRYNKVGVASVGVLFNDPIGQRNFYRLLAYKKQNIVPDSNVWDIRFDDFAFDGESFSFFTGYAFNVGDSLVGRLYHINQDLYDYFVSVSNARSANINPFIQPANIKSNIIGGIGVFSTLSFDERVLVVN